MTKEAREQLRDGAIEECYARIIMLSVENDKRWHLE